MTDQYWDKTVFLVHSITIDRFCTVWTNEVGPSNFIGMDHRHFIAMLWQLFLSNSGEKREEAEKILFTNSRYYNWKMPTFRIEWDPPLFFLQL